MLSVANNPFLMSVVMPNVIMLSVATPEKEFMKALTKNLRSNAFLNDENDNIRS
jgi:hypothetical protein